MTSSPSVSPAGRLAVVTFDWLPAWMLATWGTTWLATPAFDRLAARGVTLDAVMAPGADLETNLNAVIGPASRRLGQLNDWESFLVSDSPAVARSPLAGGFCDVLEEPAEPPQRCSEVEEATAFGRLLATAADALWSVASGPCCFWCHAGSLGVAWDAPLEFRDSLAGEDDPVPPRSAVIPCGVVAADDDPDRILGIRQAFAGQVMLADRMLGSLIDILEQLEGEPWTIVVAGLRGMPLGLHGDLGLAAEGPPSVLPYADLIQMPVIIADAQCRMAGQRYGGLLAAEDVGAFLEDHLAGGTSSKLQCLLETWACEPRPSVLSSTRRGVSLATPQWRLLVERPAVGGIQDAEPAAPRLFAKPDDFVEQCDVADRCAAVVEDLREQLEAAEASTTSRES